MNAALLIPISKLHPSRSEMRVLIVEKRQYAAHLEIYIDIYMCILLLLAGKGVLVNSVASVLSRPCTCLKTNMAASRDFTKSTCIYGVYSYRGKQGCRLSTRYFSDIPRGPHSVLFHRTRVGQKAKATWFDAHVEAAAGRWRWATEPPSQWDSFSLRGFLQYPNKMYICTNRWNCVYLSHFVSRDNKVHFP